MELTKTQIQRINDFLEGIGVELLDIRLEMVDHIASEIEEKIDDTTAFFENKGFETPFVRYMLSRKEEFRKRYKKQVKKQSSSITKAIVTDVITLLLQPKTLAPVLILFLASYYFKDIYQKEFTIVFFILFLGFFIKHAIDLYLFKKKYELLRIVEVYSLISGFIYIIPMSFVQEYMIFFEGKYDQKTLFIYFFLTIFSYLIGKSFSNKKKEIDEKFQFLVKN